MTILSSEADWEIALRNCADEAIHLIGKIQSGAVLLAIDVAADRFTHLSANAGEIFKKGLAELWKEKPSVLLGENPLFVLDRRANSWRGRGPRLLNVEFTTGTVHPSWVHTSGGNLVIETNFGVDDSHFPLAEDADWEEAVRESLNKIDNCRSLADKLETVVDETRELGGFDRVMIYRFLSDGAGEVIAEKVREDWEPFLGLRYPSSDIPAQARALFLKNDIRLISNVAAPPVPLLVNGEGPVLDLSLCRFRQPADVHLLYLTNMEVAGSFVSAIVIEEKLWGLISCHQGTPLHLSANRQARLSALTNHLSVGLAGMARESRLKHELAGARISSKLIQCVAVTDDWASVLLTMADELCKMMDADGLALVFNGQHHSHGLTTENPVIDTLAVQGLEEGGGLPFPFRRSRDQPGPVDLPANVGGYLVIPLSYFRNDSLIFFRKEQTEKILWAGNPEKVIDLSQGAPRLHPRASFAQWQEIVHGTCEEWTADQISWASMIGSTLSDIVITGHYFRQAMESISTARHRLAHEGDVDPVVLADENGIIVYQNRAAIADPFLQELQSLDSLVTRLSAGQSAEMADVLRVLAHGGDDIRLSLKEEETGSPQRSLLASRLIEGGQLVGYCIRLSR